MADGIHIAESAERYWAYDGEPTLLLGGSSQDNLFQVPGVEHQLDRLAAAGGNYVRNTMSARNRREDVLRWGAEHVWPFERTEDGYDLDRWEEAYWDRFEHFLELTAERDIVVQLEVWATFDYYEDPWEENPFNPANNVTYTAAESGLPETVDASPGETSVDEQPFFWSVPTERDLSIVREYQERFVEKILSHTLNYDHVLYCMDNETNVTPEWGAYWAEYIKDRAAEANRRVFTTEMWLATDLSDPQHGNTFDHPELYDFADVSQNNHNTGQAHYDGAVEQYERVADDPRPLNNVKIYGGYVDGFGSEHDAVERFWRDIFAGAASARFHRPPYGIGLNSRAERMVRSAREVADVVDPVTCEPRPDLLSECDPNEAFLLADPGRIYAIYFPAGGSVSVDADEQEFSRRWYDVEACSWHDEGRISGSGSKVDAPYRKQWVAVLEPASE
jgi:hypothetical protein